MNLSIRSYARNLMELANQEGSVDDCYRELKSINDELNRNEELTKYITSSEYSSAEKKRKLQEVFHNELDDSILYGLFMVIDTIPRKHMEIELIREFLTYYYQSRGIILGTVYSARELGPRELRSLEVAFSMQQEHNIKLENKIDPELIGGVKVVINENVWDSTYKAKINELRASLLKHEVKDEEDLLKQLKEDISAYNRTTGYVTSVADGVANISGIYDAMAGEILNIGGTKAMVMDLEEDNIAAVLLGNDKDIVKGTQVTNTGKVMEVPVGDELLGRVVDALGRPIDGKGTIHTTETRQNRCRPVSRSSIR